MAMLTTDRNDASTMLGLKSFGMAVSPLTGVLLLVYAG